MWGFGKKKQDTESPQAVAPATVPTEAEPMEVPTTERRTWSSMMRLPSLNKQSPSSQSGERTSLGDALRRASVESDVERRNSTDSTQEECLGGGSEGVSSSYSAFQRRAAGGMERTVFGSMDSFDLDHVYNNWPSA